MTKSRYDKLSYLDKQDVDWILNEVIKSNVYPLHMKIKAKEIVRTITKTEDDK